MLSTLPFVVLNNPNLDISSTLGLRASFISVSFCYKDPAERKNFEGAVAGRYGIFGLIGFYRDNLTGVAPVLYSSRFLFSGGPTYDISTGTVGGFFSVIYSKPRMRVYANYVSTGMLFSMGAVLEGRWLSAPRYAYDGSNMRISLGLGKSLSFYMLRLSGIVYPGVMLPVEKGSMEWLLEADLSASIKRMFMLNFGAVILPSFSVLVSSGFSI